MKKEKINAAELMLLKMIAQAAINDSEKAFAAFKIAAKNNDYPADEDYEAASANAYAFAKCDIYFAEINRHFKNGIPKKYQLNGYEELHHQIPSRAIICWELDNIRKMAEEIEISRKKIAENMKKFFTIDYDYHYEFPADESDLKLINDRKLILEIEDIKWAAIQIGEGY